MIVNMYRDQMYFFEGCDDRSFVYVIGYCKWEIYYCECEFIYLFFR